MSKELATRDAVAALELTAMPPEERVLKARQAHDMHIRGHSVAQIADALDVTRGSVTQLVQEELARANTYRPPPDQTARSRMELIIRMATQLLESGKLDARSQNNPALMKTIIEAQNKLDSYDGNDMPKRHEHVHASIAELAKMQREAERIQSQGVIEGEELIEDA